MRAVLQRGGKSMRNAIAMGRQDTEPAGREGRGQIREGARGRGADAVRGQTKLRLIKRGIIPKLITLIR